MAKTETVAITPAMAAQGVSSEIVCSAAGLIADTAFVTRPNSRARRQHISRRGERQSAKPQDQAKSPPEPIGPIAGALARLSRSVSAADRFLPASVRIECDRFVTRENPRSIGQIHGEPTCTPGGGTIRSGGYGTALDG